MCQPTQRLQRYLTSPLSDAYHHVPPLVQDALTVGKQPVVAVQVKGHLRDEAHIDNPWGGSYN